MMMMVLLDHLDNGRDWTYLHTWTLWSGLTLMCLQLQLRLWMTQYQPWTWRAWIYLDLQGAAEPGGPPILVEDDPDEVMPPPVQVPLRPHLPTADETEPSEEPSRPPSVRSPAQVPPLDPATVAMYEPAGPNDRFRLLRQQHERHETLVLPSRSRTHRSRSQHRADPGEAEPSTSTPNPRPTSAGEPHESYSQVFNVEDIQGPR